MAYLTAASPAVADVQSKVNDASNGDTIFVPVGSGAYTWASSLTVAKNVQIVGPGTAHLEITNGTSQSLIVYNAPGNTGLFRVTGFTFHSDVPANYAVIDLNSGSLLPPAYKVRIDHNEFHSTSGGGLGIINWGCRGVIDNNRFALAYPIKVGFGAPRDVAGLWSWENLPDLVFGTAHDSMYVEDNTFTNVSITLCNGGYGGRWVIRYNDITATAAMYPYFDMHGGYESGTWGGGVYGGMGGELYGNDLSFGERGWFHHRGGRALAHHNLFPTTSTDSRIKLQKDKSCPMGSETIAQRQLIQDSYYFLNRKNTVTGTIVEVAVEGDECPTSDPALAADVAFWKDAGSPPTFTGSTGVGYGTLAARPSAAGLADGIGYWATSQSVASLANMVGCAPSTPIAGTLYVVESGAWVEKYTPWTYPHPWRSISENPVDAIFEFETANDGDPVTAAVAAASLHDTASGGTPTLSQTPMDGTTISTSAQSPFTTLVTLNETTYGALGNRGMRTTFPVGAEYLLYTFPASNRVSVGFAFKTTFALTGYTGHSMLTMATLPGGEYVVFYFAPQAISYLPIRLEVNAGLASGVLPAAQSTWYWVTMLYDVPNRSGQLAMYNTSLVQIGSTLSGTLKVSPPQCDRIFLGHGADHGNYPTGYIDYDNVLLDWTSGRFPLLPVPSDVAPIGTPVLQVR